MRYTDGFKARMVQRMSGSESISATVLSKEVGVAQATLSRWLVQARTLPVMGGSSNKRNGGAKSPRQWAAEEKLRVVLEASRLSDEELGAFLRTEGLHQSQLEEWRAAVIEALGTQKTRKSKKSPEAKRIRQLEKELSRKDRALAETAALLVLQKKAQEIWGGEDDDTPTRSGT